MSNIGDKIKKLREKKGLNQAEFCKIINLGQSRLSEIENNKTKPSFDTLMSIKTSFNISLDWLIGDETAISENVIIQPSNDASIRLTDVELDMLIKFRQMDARSQEEMYEIIKLKHRFALKDKKGISSTSVNGDSEAGQDAAAGDIA